MKRFVILFDEKEGSSPLVRLLDRFADVSVVHQADGGGWEPFDRHNCGALDDATLARCLDGIFAATAATPSTLNIDYAETARQPLAFDPAAPVIGFKMRVRPPVEASRYARLLPRGSRPAGFLARLRVARFERRLFATFARHRVSVFVLVRRDALRWSLSKYHGDGSGRPGHLQFKLADGAIRREDLTPIEVDCARLDTLITECHAAYARKRRLLADLAAAGARAHVVFYEDFLADLPVYLARWFALLGHPVSPAAITEACARGAHFEKVHDDDIASFVRNHAEVHARYGDSLEGWPVEAVPAPGGAGGPRVRRSRRSEPRLFAALHSGRCGSTVLAQLEREHPAIHGDGEVYRAWYGVKAARACAEGRFVTHAWDASPWYPAQPFSYLAERAGRCPRDWYGFDMKFMHLRFIGLSTAAFVRGCSALGLEHFILLERRNHLRIIVSALIAAASRAPHVASGQAARLVRVAVDPDAIEIEHDRVDLLASLARFAAEFAEARRVLGDYNHLSLSFEQDIAGDPRVAYRKVCEFLGVRSHSVVEVKLQRGNPFALADSIENFGELRERLAGTPYAWMLDD